MSHFSKTGWILYEKRVKGAEWFFFVWGVNTEWHGVKGGGGVITPWIFNFGVHMWMMEGYLNRRTFNNYDIFTKGLYTFDVDSVDYSDLSNNHTGLKKSSLNFKEDFLNQISVPLVKHCYWKPVCLLIF